MITEEARVRIYCKLGEVLGVENAAALVALRVGPGADLVTRSDLDLFETRIERRLSEIESRMDRRVADVLVGVVGRRYALALGVTTVIAGLPPDVELTTWEAA